MWRIEGAECEADTHSRLGEWVIHVTSKANEGAPQPEVTPHVRSAVHDSDPLKQGSELLIHGPKLDIHQEIGCPFSSRQLNLVI